MIIKYTAWLKVCILILHLTSHAHLHYLKSKVGIDIYNEQHDVESTCLIVEKVINYKVYSAAVDVTLYLVSTYNISIII